MVIMRTAPGSIRELGKFRARPHLQPCSQNFDLEQKEENVSEQEQRGNVESPSAS